MKLKPLFYIAITSSLVLSKISCGQAPNLGTAANFALFTSAGAFENYGNTSIRGDIGTDIGAFSGFPPGIINGQIHNSDPNSAQAAIDTDIAYTYLDGLTCGITIGSSLGNGQILTPNVYCITAATLLDGNLIIDGQGDSNSLFIIKIDGALSTSVSSTVSVINGATFDHIYWQVNGAIEVGETSVFKGTIIANGAINILESASLYGRGLSKGGAISTHNNTIDMVSDNVILPIELITFDAQLITNKVILNWTSASEINNDFFSLERSTNGIEWKIIGLVNGAGNSLQIIQYSFTDNDPVKGVSYYKLKQTNFDGEFKYSDIITLKNMGETYDHLEIYPNPTNGVINFFLTNKENTIYSFSIYNTLGTEIFHSVGKEIPIDISENENGFYFIEVTTNFHKNIQKFELIKK